MPKAAEKRVRQREREREAKKAREMGSKRSGCVGQQGVPI